MFIRIVKDVDPKPEVTLPSEIRQQILRFDTCKVANAIETLGIRLRNEGFTRPGLRNLCGGSPRLLGYAVTSKVKCGDPPTKGAHSYFDLGDWWELFPSKPWPRVAVIEDADPTPGAGAVLSDVHAHVLLSLGCVGVVTNGAVRNIDALQELPFAVLAGFAGVSHAYVHIVGFGCPVEVFGLAVATGDLVYADQHGMIQIPVEAATDIARILEERAQCEEKLMVLCREQQPLSAIKALTQEL